jgi:hypothetical protein
MQYADGPTGGDKFFAKNLAMVNLAMPSGVKARNGAPIRDAFCSGNAQSLRLFGCYII